jgi:hypothetical protein
MSVEVFKTFNKVEVFRENNTIEVFLNEIRNVQVIKEGQQGLKGDKGDKGDTGSQGPQGEFETTFESTAKNLKSWDYSLNYSGGVLASIVYTNGVDTITKTLNYTGSTLTSIVLSGDTPSGIESTKTLNYTAGVLTSISYS